MTDQPQGGPGSAAGPCADADDPLARFSPLVRAWFAGAFEAPTAAQVGAWEAIGGGGHTLVVAPTGSGKTLAAFLSAIDALVRHPKPEQLLAERPQRRCRVLYLSPLKALAVDVERNLRSPLAGVSALASAGGQPVPRVQVAVRSGDTPSTDRRAFARDGADILITTPESLFLLLTSRAREMLAGVETVIIDEVHAVAGTKRGAHLAVSLERLDVLLDRPAQRIGLSATVRPLTEVARYLAGGRPVITVAPKTAKQIDVEVVVPVPDLAAIGTPTGDLTGSAVAGPARSSIWPHVEERVADLIESHRSTIVFVNSRRLAERLTARLNEIHAARADQFDPWAAAEAGPPAQVMAQSGGSAGAAPVLAKAHHGSVSREQRALIEDELKTGRLPAVVATSSLELGIDMGAVDLVVQVESPPSVASGLQRIGRAGHQVGAVSHGVVFPKFRGDLVSAAVAAERMRAGLIEALHITANPLDIAAQQIVAICAMDPITVDDLHQLLRRSAPFAALGRSSLEAVLDMLSGRYPSEQFAELRPRVTWDRITGVLTGRPGAQRLAVTSGGTIPDRGLYGVFLAGGDGPGRRVGELDEEMVYESRVGDVFVLGSTSWRITDISHDRVLVLPAPGLPGRLPFWKADTLGRPAELGRAHGAFVREIGAGGPDESAGPASEAAERSRTRLTAAGLDQFAVDNLLTYLADQRQATGLLPDEKTLLVERFRDELGDWRVVIHSPYGAAVHAPWALVIAARMRERYGVDVAAAHADDGIVLRLPDVEYDGGLPDVADLIALDPDTVSADVTEQIGGSAVFAGRFRECAARALLLPRRQIGKRQPLWQQRQRATQLLEVAAGFPSFPIVAEAVRECLSDVFDVDSLTDLMRQVRSGQVRLVEITTGSPSPFASSLLFGYVAQFLYEGDSPLAERRAAALTVDPALLAELLGTSEGLALRDLLDPNSMARVEADLQRLAADRQARNGDEIADLLRILGPLTESEIAARSTVERVPEVMTELVGARRAMPVRIGGAPMWADPADASVLRDALGAALPVGVAEAFLTPVADPLGRLLGRYARTHGPFTADEPAVRLGIGVAVAAAGLRSLVGSGRLAEGEFRPLGGGDRTMGAGGAAGPAGTLGAAGGTGVAPAVGHPAATDGAREFVDVEVLRLLRRRSLAALRAEVEPVPQVTLGRFLPAWNGIGRAARLRGTDAVLRAVEQLAGAVLPASALETLILPARVPDYRPTLLDELTAAGEVVWAGHGALAADDGWISLHLAETAPLTLPLPGAAAWAAPPRPLDRAGGERGVESAGDKWVTASSSGEWGRNQHDAAEQDADGADRGTGRSAEGGTGDNGRAGSDADLLGPDAGRLHRALLSVLDGGGGFFFHPLAAAVAAVLDGSDDGPHPADQALLDVLWDLVFDGFVTGDTLAPLRARLARGRTAHRARGVAPRIRMRLPSRLSVLGGRYEAPVRRSATLPTAVGRWSLVPLPELDPTMRMHAAAEVLLDRYGLVSRGSVVAEGTPGGFAGVYRVLSAMEESGKVRRGYFVEGLGAAQFATGGAVDRVRAFLPRPGGERPELATVVLAAADPANPYGAALAWPDPVACATDRHRPARRAGAMVALVDGWAVLYAERGGRSVLSFTDEFDLLSAAACALGGLVRSGAIGSMTVSRVDGTDAVAATGPVVQSLTAAGFSMTPRGLRLRAGAR